jgi:DNA-3-methyladenine glycosylase II
LKSAKVVIIPKTTTMKRIRTLAELETATSSLCEIEPRFAAVVKQHGIPSLRVSPQALEGLLIIITEQFLSLQAAAAIWARLKSRLCDCSTEAVLECPQAELIELGLSRTKAKAFHAAALSDLDFTEHDETAVTKKLCAIHGVGPWTADIYLLSVLGAADACPAGDLALRIAIQDFLNLEHRPEISHMAALAETWRPHRAVAARLLWSHYRGLKGLAQA